MSERQGELHATRNLPKRLRTLRSLMVGWQTRERLRRGDLVITDLVAFVRHNYTNYEAILEAHEPPEGADQDGAMRWVIEHKELRRNVKHKATLLAERLLRNAYGEEWQR